MPENFQKFEKEKPWVEKEEKEPEIEIDPQFLRKLEVISQVIGGDFNMKVEIGKPEEPSQFIPEQNKIIFNPLSIKESLNRAIRTAAHEGEHRAISRFPQQIGVKKEKIKELYSKIGFRNTDNVLEDLAVDNWGGNRYPELRALHKEARDEAFKAIEQGKRLIGTLEAIWAIKQFKQLGYIPKFVQYGIETVRKFHQGKVAEQLDPKVKTAVEKTADLVKEFSQTIPTPEQRSESEIIEKARERFALVAEKIWPEVEKLVKEDFKDEKLRQMVLSTPEEILSQLPKQLRKELKQQMTKSEQEKEDFVRQEKGKVEEEIKNLEKEIENLKEKQGKAGKEEKEELEKEIQEKELQKERKEKELEEIKEETEEAKQQFGLPLPMDQLSEELKKELERIFENLDEKQKKGIEEKSQKSLEDLEDKIAKDLEGKLSEEHPPSHQEIREAEIKKEREEKEREEIERARKELAEKMERLKSQYDKYYEEVVELIDDLYERLAKIFLLERRPRWKKGFPRGGRIDLLKAMEFEAAREQGVPSSAYQKMFERKIMPEKRDYKFLFLVDMSDSMQQPKEKIEETFKGLILLSEVLNRLDIDFAVYGYAPEFPDNIKPFKTFDQEFKEDIRNELSQILKAEGSATPTGSATKVASEILEKNRGKNNFLVTITDGQPNRGLDTHQVIGEIKEKTKQKLIGLGLGPDTEFVKGFYPASLGGIKAEQLPETLAQLLEDMILYPQKYE